MVNGFRIEFFNILTPLAPLFQQSWHVFFKVKFTIQGHPTMCRPNISDPLVTERMEYHTLLLKLSMDPYILIHIV